MDESKVINHLNILTLEGIFKCQWKPEVYPIVTKYLVDKFINGAYTYENFYYAFYDYEECKYLEYVVIGIIKHVLSTKGNERELMGFVRRCITALELDITEYLIPTCDYDTFCFVIKFYDIFPILHCAYAQGEDRLKVIVEYYIKCGEYQDAADLIESYISYGGDNFNILNAIIRIFNIDIVKLCDETNYDELKNYLVKMINNQV